MSFVHCVGMFGLVCVFLVSSLPILSLSFCFDVSHSLSIRRDLCVLPLSLSFFAVLCCTQVRTRAAPDDGASLGAATRRPDVARSLSPLWVGAAVRTARVGHRVADCAAAGRALLAAALAGTLISNSPLSLSLFVSFLSLFNGILWS